MRSFSENSMKFDRNSTTEKSVLYTIAGFYSSLVEIRARPSPLRRGGFF
jgi:hypothetical protein